MRCPKCGKLISDDSQFCEYCGKQLISANDAAKEASVHVRWLLWMAAVVLCGFNISVFSWQFMPAACGEYSYLDTNILWVIPVLLLIVCIISLILFRKKKLKGSYSILLFLVLGINIIIPIYAEDKKYCTENYQVSASLYVYDTYIGSLERLYYELDDAEKLVQTFDSIVYSSPHYKYTQSRAYLTNRIDWSNFAYDIERVACALWFVEALVLFIYLVMASIDTKKERKQKVIIIIR